MLENDKITLRGIEIKDVDFLYKWENDRSNWSISHTISPYSRQVLMHYIENVTDVYSDKQLRLVIESIEEKRPLGTVDLFDCDFKNRKAGIGILIAEQTDRNKGWASEVLNLILPYCFQVLNLHQVYCNILENNPESIHLFEKYGFKKLALKKDWVLVDGEFQNEWLLQKINEDE